jgi:hypothetical protein
VSELLKVQIKYTYPEKGTRNGRVYSREVLEKAFSDPAFIEYNENKAIPVKSEDNDFIGLATTKLDNGTTVTIDAEIFSHAYIEALKADDKNIGFTLAGYGNTIHKDGVDTVTDFTIDSVLLCRHSAVDCQTKFV